MSCQTSGLTDAVTTQGIPGNWRLKGQILVGYIGPDNTHVVNRRSPSISWAI